ncbi:putative membrane protein [Pedobacter cryoconitis]|uniref:cell wall-active antibiotics response protein n=1 Tax=Pedobacter cryoconitis TaxID=188932 RepID=UPI0017E6FC4A|nr:cell wall-active antibiotics response protein [Pedobacter cryoconitis]MBB6272241.1 putative membrane protein [Pedobacter cryoconitis]
MNTKIMENNKYKNSPNRIWSGLILLIIGAVFLLRNFGFDIPYWVFNWPMLLIVIGLVIGAKRRFNGGGWLIMILVGGYFTLQSIADFNLTQYYIGAGFIILGLYLILKPRKPRKDWYGTRYDWHSRKYRAYSRTDWRCQPTDPMANTADTQGNATDPQNNPAGSQTDPHQPQGDPGYNQAFDPYHRAHGNETDFIDSVNVFGGSKRQVYSKNFKGGDIVSVFGGCELDLRQADFENTVAIEVVAIFGGVKLIIPPTWIVKSELTPIFGGLDDKRSVNQVASEPPKIITINGVALFGGVSISNY